MAFFDKKEDVLDFQLTEYGKHLLQQGVLDPVYYAFFDDDILYDSNAAGISEAQNSSARRIKYETPSLKVQPNTTGAETRVAAFLEAATGSAGFSTIAENSVQFVDAFNTSPQFQQKFFIGADPLGTSDLQSEYAPAWHLNCLANHITSSDTHYAVNLTASNVGTSEGIVRNIPQLDIEIDYKTFFADSTEMNEYDEENISEVESFISDSTVGLFVEENYLVMQIEEKNTNFLKENFSIEVYESGSDGTLTRLNFIGDDNQMNPTTSENVEHYMNIWVDDEMPSNVSDALGITRDSLQGRSVRIQLRRDLYETEEGGQC
tara:strand:- start:10923 stop:11879 length:957 start_codon:yes stop_codon:yes gene_type:complete